MHYDQQLQEALMINDVYSKLSQQRAAAVGEEFERPPPRTFRAVVHCEIVSARYCERLDHMCNLLSYVSRDFDHDNLFVHYFTELPLGWTVAVVKDDETNNNQNRKNDKSNDPESESQLYGMTHKSLTTADGDTGRDVAHFSHTFTLDLFFDVNRFDIEQVRSIQVKCNLLSHKVK